MSRSDLDRLHDARAFVSHARGNAGGLPAHILADAVQPQHAALFDLAVVGEALSKVSSAIRSAAPDLPWKAIINLRNVIVHSYWQVDLDLIADVIENHLDPLNVELDALIALVEGDK